ncbi:monovalent cation/H+ antiporter subunit A [Ruixingdingia sedimenti]|uniref:Monovalent cation/H+ antiporter subunit A n=1 Tax=Ruixingdingia sedimenti TaxID=3073604 RepID=A0ABU1F8T0_9RHOB|nr:monovalent cation/H+ antiporter subunit A [Xinfangfangia sp. LG-4]MDR5653277.1 monovalent cation/H+ antiporter subunit A [Xinfangfangia sp. LG-4]
MSLALIAALPFLGALFPGLMIRAGRGPSALAAAAANALALLGLLIHAPAVLRGEVIHTRIEWLPGLGMDANFFLDGLGLLFAGLILGIGLLIILYARYYLSKSDPMGQFYTYLMLFQGAMVGIVLSDNILVLLVFWELTSLSSFLLIGYWKHLPEGRQGARMALIVTASGGLAMIAGMLILGHVAGSHDLSVILTQAGAIQASEWYLPALLLILLGCFTKSAQFPFHFWLPHAMAAPTPVSAYLHSATMVKAGLFLMARLWPVLSGTAEWFWLVAGAGLITMVIGAVIGLFKDDLKALLAFSTVSHLGLITMLLGFGTKAAAVAAVFHIIAHASFKAALFMAAGIVDHEAGTRDIKRLGGLRTLMPVTFAIVAVAALSMAGIPPLNGFLSKEMMLEEVLHAGAGGGWLLVVLATVGAAFSVAYSFRLIAHVFLGPVRSDYPHHPHDPGFGMWAAPALLAVLVVLIGLWPMTLAGGIVAAAAGAVTGGAVTVNIHHWHGLVPALFLSIVAVGTGLVLVGGHRRLDAIWTAVPRPEAKRIFDAIVDACAAVARGFTDGLHNGALTRYLAIFTLGVVVAGVWAFRTGTHAPGDRLLTEIAPVPVVAWVALVICSVLLMVLHRDRLLALVLIAVVGLMVSITFIYLSAPDLALTQISVEVVTVVLMLLALNFLPKRTPVESGASKRLRDLIVAGAAGVGVAALAYALMTRDFAFPTISDYHLAHSKSGGGGTNVVNVILVDFRGYDTFGEITVVGIAALLVFALTETLLRGGRANRRLLAWVPDQRRAGDRHPMMAVIATRMILPVALVVGVYIFLRGHNDPGGGFIAGLVVAIALLMQYMASGFAWADARQRLDYHALIGAGVFVAGLTGIGAWFAGRPFLTSDYGYVRIPPLEEFELATAAIFDLGVFLTVVGAVMLMLASLTRIAIRAGETVNIEPMDVDPSAPSHGTEGR